MASKRSALWKWLVCGLLLLASAINYMDRQTLANTAPRITAQFGLKQEQYGNLELGFGWAFAAGSVLFGLLADKIPLRWMYPAVLLLWSAAGVVTGLIRTYPGLLACRVALGFFEAGHWPCAVKTTQYLLAPSDRSMGNSVLQSGTSIGAVITPLILSALLTPELGSWRFAFQAVGLLGLLWIVLWFTLIGKEDLKAAAVPSSPFPRGEKGEAEGADAEPDSVSPSARAPFWKLMFTRRMLIVILVIALINTSWQLIRAWLPKILVEGRGYTEKEMLYFNSVFYVATDLGCIGAGFLTLFFHRFNFSVVSARKLTFFLCSLLSALTLAAAFLPKSVLFLALILLVGAGALGVFPVYHAFTQDISPHHQGKVTGIGGIAGWILSPAQKYYGRLVDKTGSFDLGFAVAGCLPFIAFVVLGLFWKENPVTRQPSRNRSTPAESTP